MQEIVKNIINKAVPPLLVIAAVVFLFVFTDIFKKEPPVMIPPPPPPPIQPSEFPDYEAFKSMEKKLVLVENRETFSPKNKPIIGRVKKTIEVGGEFSRIYIYIEASVDNGKPLTQWDSIYMSIQYVGGHIFRFNSLKVSSDTVTKLLYGLNQMPFLESIPYSETKTPIIKNWFALFRDGARLEFDAFISTLRQGGKLNLVELRYECETNSDCFIK
ncbi:hypothetical protein A3J02_01965 [Candidatus Azambacteria bacterium RIFCSPLOWO2_02_FULL_46_11]|uniref:Uncharacterized protein n=3 Tax=Candidatus Azamiibacteriota TaxID=1752741 RepID=A0A1F5C7E8_9BACT|nr:MAG: hypothetical protein A2W60_01635 [Candidatus Azambacteria bacterium RIFCSPHIGHO2_02_46_12]OGD38787.1 MAG: hypothetical protein A3A25_03505 [Candidatus Azambacteria bacterium RIFCSPLOWO2_01_FULL_46_26]OGD44160.1 MAG: hypothetical protein A3J02_01965 [Candidatus Azambacteria bacterium RIFCSPLOWO2_02_FULL_46_11]